MFEEFCRPTLLLPTYAFAYEKVIAMALGMVRSTK